MDIYFIQNIPKAHYAHKAFAEAINATFILPGPKKIWLPFIPFYNLPKILLSFKEYKKNSKFFCEGVAGLYFAGTLKIFRPDIKIIYHDADALFYRDYPRFRGLKKKFVDFFLKKIDFIISDSKISKKYINKYLHKPTRVVYPFVDTRKFHFNPNLKSKNIIYVGRLADEKNLFRLLEAYKLIKKKISRSKLYIIGDGPQRKELERYVRKKRINGVCFTGWLKNFKKYLNDSIIGYNVSKFEPFGCAGLEYVLSGIIPLLGKRNGNIEVLNEKMIIADPNNSWDIAKKILFLLNLSEEEKLGLIKKLRKRALKINKENQCKKFKTAFEELIR